MCPSSLPLSLSTHIFLFFIWACEFFLFVLRRTLAHNKKRAKAYVYNVYSSRPCLPRVEKNNNLPSPIPNPPYTAYGSSWGLFFIMCSKWDAAVCCSFDKNMDDDESLLKRQPECVASWFCEQIFEIVISYNFSIPFKHRCRHSSAIEAEHAELSV